MAAKGKNKKDEQETIVQDDVLSAFNEVKGEQMDLLGETEVDSEENNQEPEYDPTVKKEIVYYGVDGTEYNEEEWNSPVIKFGPTRKEVEGWKERHGDVYFTPFESQVFVWRTLKRPEYREVIRDNTLTALDREEVFTERCVLFPYDFSIEKILKSRAGIASLLSEMVMDKSGFVAQSGPVKL